MNRELDVFDEVYVKWTNKWTKIIRINKFLYKDNFGFLAQYNLAPFVITEYFTELNENSICGYDKKRLLHKDDYIKWNRKRVARRMNS